MVYIPQSAVKLAIIIAHTGPDVRMDFHGTLIYTMVHCQYGPYMCMWMGVKMG